MLMPEDSAVLFKCSICFCTFKKPVLTECDHIFCRKCLQEWVRAGNSTCAVCRRTVVWRSVRQIVSPLTDIIKNSYVKCRCSALAKLNKIQDHEEVCHLNLKSESWTCDTCNVQLTSSTVKDHSCVAHFKLVIQTHRAQLDQAAGAQEELIKSMASLRQVMSMKEEEVSGLKIKMEELQETGLTLIHKNRERIGRLKKIILTKDKELETLNKNLADKKSEVKMLSSTMKNQIKKTEEMEKEKEVLGIKLEQSKSYLSMRDETVKELNRNLEEKEMAMQELSRTISNQIIEIERKEKQNQNLEIEIRELESFVGVKENELTLLSTILKSKETEVGELISEKSSLEAQLEESKFSLALKDEATMVLNIDLKHTEPEMEVLSGIIINKMSDVEIREKRNENLEIQVQELKTAKSTEENELPRLNKKPKSKMEDLMEPVMEERMVQNEVLFAIPKEKGQSEVNFKMEITSLKEVIPMEAEERTFSDKKLRKTDFCDWFLKTLWP